LPINNKNNNPVKYELLCLSNKHTPAKPLYYINNHLLYWVRYLGVIADPKLSWNHNVSYVSKKATKVLIFLRRHMYTCRATSIQKAFRALVIPVLDYAIVQCGIHILTKTLLLLNKFKTVVLAGFVEVDFVLEPINGLNHLKNVVQNYSGHHSPLDESTCP